MQLDCDDPMTDLVEGEVLQERGPRGVSVEDTQHLLASVRQQLLSITRVRDRLAFLCVAIWANINTRTDCVKKSDKNIL